MVTPSPEKLITNKKRVIKELVRGRKFATELKNLLSKSGGDDGCVSSAEELVENICRSFTETLSMLKNSCDIQAIGHVDSTCYSDGGSQDCDNGRMKAVLKDRRGSYKRRKTLDSRIIISPTIEDSHAWRKYGQKEILNAKYPRCYFRCTYKNDQGCRATKQVQRLEEDPSMYQITYFGDHICIIDRFKAPQIILDSDPAESYLLSFESIIPTKQDPLSCPTMKEESKEDSQSELSDNLPSLDSIWWPDLMALESSRPPSLMLNPKMENNHQKMVSTVYSGASTSLDVDTLIRSVDFDNDFQFDDETEFL